MKMVTVAEMKAIENEANDSGLSYEIMMENAGHNLADEVLQLATALKDQEEIQVIGLVGPGKNGGDTLIGLSHLSEKGWIARAYLVGRKASEDPLIQRLIDAGGEIIKQESDDKFNQLHVFMETADVLLDGILGTGFKQPLRKELGLVLEAAQGIIAEMTSPPMIVAVDCPSGVDCDTGAMAAQVIPADATVTMGAIKQGQLRLPAFGACGELQVISIGNLDHLRSWQELSNDVADDEQVIKMLPVRELDAYKGTFGTALVIAGSQNYTGAALLAGESAYRSGAGLVTMAIPASLHSALAGAFPEATWLLLPHEQGVIAGHAIDVIAQSLPNITAILVGPGLGLEDTTRDFMKGLLDGTAITKIPGKIGFVHDKPVQAGRKPIQMPPLVVDADALKLLVKIPEWSHFLASQTILTPHPGEMAILTGLSVDEVQSDRLSLAKKYASVWGHIIVLKGAFTIIASPDGRSTTIPIATPALARAGSGDVLAGIIVGLRAQGIGAYESAVAGAWIHAQAGLAAADRLGTTAGVIARDIVASIPDVLPLN